MSTRTLKGSVYLGTALGLVLAAPALAQQTPGDQSGTAAAAGAGQSAATSTNAPADAPAPTGAMAPTETTAAPAEAAVAPARARRSADGEGGSGDIVVTARRVEERLQDVPISITVFNQQQLQNRNVTTAQDLATYTPSLSADTRFGSNNTTFAIRGFVQDINTPPSVGVYFADVISPRANSNNLPNGNGAGPGSFFDLQNVQVLKGPQGTLFGRNTTGGAVLLVPQKPSSKLEGYVEGSYGNYDMKRIQAVLNIPLSDIARFRVGVDRQTRDGYVHNRSGIGPSRFDDIDYVAARASLVVDLTPDLENYTIGSYTRSNTTGLLSKVIDAGGSRSPVTVGVGGNSAQILLAPLAQKQLDREAAAGFGFYDAESDFANPGTVSDQWQIINTTTWRASDDLTVKNIASYAQIIVDYNNPVFGTALRCEDFLGAGFCSGPLTFSNSSAFPGGHTAQQSTFTEEFQLQGNSAGGKLRWQAGAYYELSEPLGPSGSISPSLASCTDVYALQCTAPLASLGAGSVATTEAQTRFRNVGLYAQGTYSLTDTLKLTGGFRYTWDKTTADAMGRNFGINATFNPVTGLRVFTPGVISQQPCQLDSGTLPDCAFSVKQSSKAPTWLIDLDYTPTNDILLYAKWARGYRAGGTTPQGPSGLRTFEPEKVDTYEVGLKTSFRGAVRGTFNISAFYNDFRNQQTQFAVINATTGSFFTIVENLGKSRIYGAEVEASITPFDGFTLDGSYSYLNTKVQKAIPAMAPTGVAIGVDNLPQPGDPLALSPKHKLSVTGTYTLPLDESIGRVSLGATFSYTAKALSAGVSPASDPNNPFLYIPSTKLLNLNLNWNSIAGTPIDLSLFATNVTNKKYVSAYNGTLNTVGFEVANLGEPRMYGARLRYRFGAGGR